MELVQLENVHWKFLFSTTQTNSSKMQNIFSLIA